MRDLEKYLPSWLKEADQETIHKFFLDLLDKAVQEEEEIVQSLFRRYDPVESYGDIEKIYQELGLDYIINLLELNEDLRRSLALYFHIVRYLKGSRKGLEFVLSVLGLDFEITEWWEKDPAGEVFTFDMSITVDVGVIPPDFTNRIINFCRNYVYPVVSLYINYKINLNLVGAIHTFNSQQVEINMMDGVPLMIGLKGTWREMHTWSIVREE